MASDASEPEFESIEEALGLWAGPIRYSDSDPWLLLAKRLTDEAIDELIREFIKAPYLHRKEHSIHLRLYELLVSNEELKQRVPLGKKLGETRLIHKEWPEAKARRGKRRGNTDLVVLPPSLLARCPDIPTFREGRLEPPIVIEVALDYDLEHLRRDVCKLIDSKPKYGYIVHLVRDCPIGVLVEQDLLQLEKDHGIRAAYAWVLGQRTRFKLLNDQSIRE